MILYIMGSLYADTRREGGFKEGQGMVHLTRLCPRARVRRTAKRALAGLLCAAMLGGATALAADGDTIIAPGFDIAGTGFKNPEIELDYVYYWRDAAIGGIPTSDDPNVEIPVLITWNDNYYLRGDAHLVDQLRSYAPHTSGGNTAAHIPYLDLKGGDYVTDRDFTKSEKVKSTADLVDTLQDAEDIGRDNQWIGWLRYISNDEWIYERVDFTGFPWDDDEYEDFYQVDEIKDNTWNFDYEHGRLLGGIGFYYHYRHYKMEASAHLSNVGVYNDLKRTGTAVTTNIPDGVPFLLDCGKEEGANQHHRYALGFRTKEGAIPHFLYGAFFLRSRRLYSGVRGDALRSYAGISQSGWEDFCSNKAGWANTGDWFLYSAQYTPEQFKSPQLNLKYNSNSECPNMGINQRTWTFDATPSGQFTIGTDGTAHNDRVGGWYDESKYENAAWITQPRLTYLLSGAIYEVTEGWLYHDGSVGSTAHWLRYWGGHNVDKNHAGLADNDHWQYQFKVYCGVPQLINFVNDDFRVQSGQTVTLEGPLCINKGHKITVEDGGVLSLTGWIMNNGSIEVQPGGTIVVQHRETADGDYQEGLVGPLGLPAGSENGCIRCDGTMVVESNATVIGAGKYGLQFGESADVVNYGTLAAENFEVYRDHTIDNRGYASRVFCGWGLKGTGYGLTRVKNDGGSTFDDMARVESTSVVRLAKDGIFGQRGNAVYINSAGAVNKTTNMANRTGLVNKGVSTSAQRLAVRILDFDPAEWEKHYFLVPEKVKV